MNTANPAASSVGDTVILPEYGGSNVGSDDKELFIFREHDILVCLDKN
ncbi:co-chaperone GroES family protein [Streptomyces sp. NBC_00237]